MSKLPPSCGVVSSDTFEIPTESVASIVIVALPPESSVTEVVTFVPPTSVRTPFDSASPTVTDPVSASTCNC